MGREVRLVMLCVACLLLSVLLLLSYVGEIQSSTCSGLNLVQTALGGPQKHAEDAAQASAAEAAPKSEVQKVLQKHAEDAARASAGEAAAKVELQAAKVELQKVLQKHAEDAARASAAEAAKVEVQKKGKWISVPIFVGGLVDDSSWWKKSFDKPFHGQVAQDRTVVSVFGDTPGYFVDLASNSAVFLSNTIALERDFGWRGLAVEPNPQYWQFYAGRPNTQLVGAVVSNVTDTPVDMIFSTGYMGGIVGKNMDNKKGGEVSMRALSLPDLLRSFGAPKQIEYFSLDVEGAEELVLQNFPFHEFVFLTISIERPKIPLQTNLLEHGFEYVGDHGTFGDTFWLNKQMPDFERQRVALIERLGVNKHNWVKPRPNATRPA